MLDTAAADEEVAHALVARRHPVIEAVRAKERQSGFKDGRKEGFKDGRKEGFKDGRKDGRRELLLDQMHTKFGNVPELFVQRVRAADDEKIQRWAERILIAETLDDLIAES